MKRITASLFVMLTTVALVSLCARSSFAAKAMSDSEMDSTTAMGQSAIDMGEGDQFILDHSQYELTVKDSAQESLQAGNAVNVAGENNVASAINAGTSSGSTVNQYNHVDQNKAATIANSFYHSESQSFSDSENSSKSFSASLVSAATASESSSKSFSESENSSFAFSQTLAPATITINGTVSGNATATSSGNATADNTTTAIGNAQSTTTGNTTLTGTGTGTGNAQSDNSGSVTATGNGNSTVIGNSKNINVNAAIGASIGLDLVKADGKANSRASGSIDIDLPKATSGNGSSSESASASCSSSSSEAESCSSSLTSSCSSSETKSCSASETDAAKCSIIADTVKVGTGNQTVFDCTKYEVELKDNAQQNAIVLNLFNVAGRNNAATALNIASEITSFGIGGGAAGAIVQANSISQLN